MHRDLKPANLMIVDADTPREKIKVMDFGLAKMIDAAAIQKITDTHVDFAALAAAAKTPTFGPIAQGDFLRRLGILQRAASLKARANEAQRAAIDAALARLIGSDQMGTLFRVLAVGDGRSSLPAGFSEEE